MSNNNNFSR